MNPPRRSIPNRLKRVFKPVLNLIVRPLSGLAPRSAKQWVFGHIGGVFAGNPRYLYLWMVANRPDIRVTWITGSEETRRLLASCGLRVRRRWSPGGMIAVLRAGVFVVAHGPDNINVQLGRGALLVNLWHGVGLKAVQFGQPDGSVSHARAQAETRRFGRLGLLEYLAEPDVLATTSDFTQAHFSRQFELPPGRCPKLGYPRLDCAGDDALAAASRAIDRAAGFVFNPDEHREVWLYLPTFRDTERPFLDTALPDLDRLSAALRSSDAILYLKLHPRSLDRLPPERDNIRIWPAEIDFHTYLAALTGLITDYSSALYDYLYVRDSGAILYTFDHDEYLAKDRSLLYPFDDNVAGLRVDRFEDLCAALADGRALTAGNDRVPAIRERFWGGAPSPASSAVVAHVEKRLANA